MRVIHKILLVLLCLQILFVSHRYMFREHSIKIIHKISYISSIDMPPTQKQWSEQLIADINSKRNNPVLKSSGIRPIWIKPYDFKAEGEKEKLGVAIFYPYACKILIGTHLYEDKQLFEDTLVHEILHCYGYDHTPNAFDIMHYYLSEYTISDTQRFYWSEMYKNIYFN